MNEKSQIGFKDHDELEALMFTKKELYDRARRYCDRNTVFYRIWIVEHHGHHQDGLLLRAADAAILKPSYNQYRNIKSNLLK